MFFIILNPNEMDVTLLGGVKAHDLILEPSVHTGSFITGPTPLSRRR